MTGFADSYRGKTVFITGHTGFKGSWLALWLTRLGAKVVGYALPPSGEQTLFEDLRLAELVTHIVGDVRDRNVLAQAMQTHRPDVVFHLAAQSLVRPSYAEPVETFETNVMGTVNLLEAVRQTSSVRACVVVTSDKCYENREWIYAYRENDAMGGFDPYSASKGCAELVTSSYRRSYFPPESHAVHGVGLASVRAGNVIGGGDWAVDRIVPDCMRALMNEQAIQVRNPSAIRPWQHVLEPLAGYLWLGSRLLQNAPTYSEGWNFGPHGTSNITVQAIVEAILQRWGSGSWVRPVESEAPHEAHFLKLDITKAVNALGWQPVFDINATIDAVVDWYAAYHHDAHLDVRAFTLRQIEAYERTAAQQGLAWAPAPCEVP
ncbi:CDP-glucose 4,6-dehydratase [bacterium]|nr:CDP-glucose 4,6-dehydratase [bacterium]